MSHRNDCPQPWEARREGYRAGEEQSYARNPYKSNFSNAGCEDASRNWDRGQWDAEYDREREEEERRDAERHEQRRQEEMAQEQAAYEAHMEEQARAEYEQEPEPEPEPEQPDDEIPF